MPKLCLLYGTPAHYVTLTLVLCQGVGIALVTQKFRLWPPITGALLLPAWHWPTAFRLIDLLGLYLIALAAPCFVFIRSLFPNQDPLITKFARQVHGTLRPDIIRYTYYLTWFWSLFFVAALLAPLILFLYGPHNAWRWPLNGATLGLALIFLGLEYGIRRLAIRHFDHASLRTSIDIFRKQP
ncbi:hypothetical protein ACI01nite_19380 [Acetobacter cibinongensis]|uniref:Uncharacterized protein n=1 Tax=Acetobacter cibinongensis TaxID=146475 RepID=A0A0D6N2M2_9PROT|nr:hypothetical protein Abci_007_216 [Acetobacter cibinongensis]GEL59336.1 hypothetical protein ACI01nite_19380 [Acetobacter cibinongensis]